MLHSAPDFADFPDQKQKLTEGEVERVCRFHCVSNSDQFGMDWYEQDKELAPPSFQVRPVHRQLLPVVACFVQSFDDRNVLVDQPTSVCVVLSISDWGTAAIEYLYSLLLGFVTPSWTRTLQPASR
jgi:hypothetical protein